MENPRPIASVLFLGALLCAMPLLLYAYDDDTTHPALTQEMIRFFESTFPQKDISDTDTQRIIQGSIDEDADGRWMRHFYDPIHHKGLTYAGIQWQSAKSWSADTLTQATYRPQDIPSRTLYGKVKDIFSAETDYSWKRGIYEYAWGNKQRGLETLGHILHLIEDMSVPDHTRNDPHPGAGKRIAGFAPTALSAWLERHDSFNESPYESFAVFAQGSLHTADEVQGQALPAFTSLNAYFEDMAKYSNGNFFSGDTINSAQYSSPVILEKRVEKLSDGESYQFGYSKNQNEPFRLVLIKGESDWRAPDYFLGDPDHKILTSYFSLLSKQAVLNGAGVIRLFFDEAEQEKQTKALYEKNRSWLAKQVDRFRQNTFGLAGILYGSSVALSDLEEETSPAPQSPAPEKESVLPLPPPSPSVRTPSSPVASSISELTPPKTSSPKTASSEQKAEIADIESSSVSVPAQNNTSDETARSHGNVSDEIIALARIQKTSPVATSSTASSTVSASTTADTTAPSVSLLVSECADSLAPSACLIATTTITLVWKSTAPDLAWYAVSCVSAGASCTGFSSATTSATTTLYTIPSDNADYIFSVIAYDTSNNASAPAEVTVSVATRPVVINEVAWAGTSAAQSSDEWIELYNPTAHTVSLSGWILYSGTNGDPYIMLSRSIPAKGFFLLERTSSTTIPDIAEDQTYTGALSNSGEQMILSRASTTIDRTPGISACGGWCGTVAGTYRSMERIDPSVSGDTANNWTGFAGIPSNGTNADGLAIEGTPKKRNSVDYIPPAIAAGSRVTLTANKSPYIVSGEYTVPTSATLQIQPGVVLKFDKDSSLKVNGALTAEGTSGSPTIFTSLADDTYGGDTNGTTTLPSAGDWRSITITSTAAGSTISHAITRYGGASAAFGDYAANIWIKNSNTAIRDSVIEHSKRYGIRMDGTGGGAITSNAIRKNGMAGLFIYMTGSLTVEDNALSENSNAAIDVLNSYPTFSGNTAKNNGINGIQMKLVLDRDYTFSNNLPYYMIEDNTVMAGTTLTILAGAILKFDSLTTCTVKGRLAANGTSAAPVIFTSLADDTYGGDTNGDGTTSAPAVGDWHNITFVQNLATSTLSHVRARYGGRVGGSTPGVLAASHASIVLNHAVVEKNYIAGIGLSHSTSTMISDTVIRDHRGGASGTFYGLHLSNSSTPRIADTRFSLNDEHIFWDGTSTTTDLGGNVLE